MRRLRNAQPHCLTAQHCSTEEHEYGSSVGDTVRAECLVLVALVMAARSRRDIIPVPKGPDGQPGPSKYDLVANICHDGARAAQNTLWDPQGPGCPRAATMA